MKDFKPIIFRYKKIECICNSQFNQNCFEVYDNKKIIGHFLLEDNTIDQKCIAKFDSICTLFNNIEPIFQMKVENNSIFTSLIERNNFFRNAIDFYLDYGKFLINKTIFSYKFYYEYNNFQFDLTCSFCPEQYDVYYNFKYIGYIRVRHGFARFSDSPCGNIEYLNEPKEESINDEEAHLFLQKCAESYLLKNKKKKSV